MEKPFELFYNGYANVSIRKELNEKQLVFTIFIVRSPTSYM